VAPELADIYDLDAALYQGCDPDSAEGVQLDNIATLAGITREPATRSTGIFEATGTPATVLAVGKRARIPGGEMVRITAEATIPGGGVADVNYEAVDAGPLGFGIGSITEIVDAVFGWVSVDNAAEANEGDPEESDSLLRARIARSKAAAGNSTDSAIRARIEDLDDVEAAAAVSNRTLVTDGNGTPGKTLWIVIDPSTVDADELALIVETIWGPAGLPSGIATRGAQQGTVTDNQGYVQIFYWDWATEVRTWITATLTMDADYPAGGDALVKDAIVAWGQSNLSLAGTINPQPIDTAVDLAVPGIAKLVITLSITAPPGGGDDDPIPLAINQRAAIAIGDVSVVAT